MGLHELKLINLSCSCSLVCEPCEACYHTTTSTAAYALILPFLQTCDRFLFVMEDTNSDTGYIVVMNESLTVICSLVKETQKFHGVEKSLFQTSAPKVLSYHHIYSIKKVHQNISLRS